MQAALQPFPWRDAPQDDPERVAGGQRSLAGHDEVTGDKLLTQLRQTAASGRRASRDFRKHSRRRRTRSRRCKWLYSKRTGRVAVQQVKELAAALKCPSDNRSPATAVAASELAEPAKVKARGGKALVDVIRAVRHAIRPDADLCRSADGAGAVRPVVDGAGGRGVTFTRTSANGWTRSGTHRDESAGRAETTSRTSRSTGSAATARRWNCSETSLLQYLKDLNTTLAA